MAYLPVLPPPPPSAPQYAYGQGGGTGSGGGGGTSPATERFSMWRSGDQTISNATFTKVQFNTTEFATTAGDLNTTTTYRYTAHVHGDYHFSWLVLGQSAGATMTNGWAVLYKNGAAVAGGDYSKPEGEFYRSGGSRTLRLNVGDYIEVYAYINSSGGTPKVLGSQVDTYLSGFLIAAI